MKSGYNFRRLILIVSWLEIVDAAAENAHLLILSLVLGTKCCLGIDDLRVPGVSKNVSRLSNLLS